MDANAQSLRTKITPIIGEPTNATLHTLQLQLEQNAIAIKSAEGDGLHGHLILTISDQAYTARTGAVYHPPHNPGSVPDFSTQPGVVLSADERGEIKDTFKAETIVYKLYQNTDTVLTTALLEAIDPDFLDELRVNGTLYTRTCFELLTYLHERYGRITAEQMDANNVNLNRDWNPDEPIVKLWARVTECIRISTASLNPIHDVTAITALLKVLGRTKVFEAAIDRWREREEIAWNLADFKTTFDKAAKERVRKITAGEAGFNGANAALSARDNEIADLKEQLATALAVKANPTPTPRDRRSKKVDHTQPTFYCWTHGFTNNKDHSSKTCQHKKEGHKAEATKEKQLGGSNKGAENN